MVIPSEARHPGLIAIEPSAMGKKLHGEHSPQVSGCWSL